MKFALKIPVLCACVFFISAFASPIPAVDSPLTGETSIDATVDSSTGADTIHDLDSSAFLFEENYTVSYSHDSAFFHLREQELRRQYRLCTKDTSDQPLSHILRWRNKLKKRMNSDEYRSIRNQFLSHTKKFKSFTPCEVFTWHQARVDSIERKEKELEKELAKSALDALDSAAVVNHLTALAASPFDFESIPFGASREIITDFCLSQWGIQLQQRATYSYGDTIHVNGKPFSIVFYYKNNHLIRYELESPSTYPPDSLDTVVRAHAKHLSEYYEQRIGPADRLYRIGFFDIKSNLLTPYARWEDNGYVAIVGIVRDKGRFFAKARIYRDRNRTYR